MSATKKTNKALLAAILVPSVIAALVAGALIIVVRRRRNSREDKRWEGSRVPELETRSSLWSFVMPSKDVRPRVSRDPSTYAGDGDWNRSDAQLRGAAPMGEKDRYSVAESVAESNDHAWEASHSDPGHVSAFTRAFHSESPMHDEPALAESRRATVVDPADETLAGPVGPVA